MGLLIKNKKYFQLLTYLSLLAIPILATVYSLLTTSESVNDWLLGYSMMRWLLILGCILFLIANITLVYILSEKLQLNKYAHKYQSLLERLSSFDGLITLVLLIILLGGLIAYIWLSTSIPSYLKIEYSIPFSLTLSHLIGILNLFLQKFSLRKDHISRSLHTITSRILKILGIITLIIISLYFIVLVFTTIIQRINYPYALEWMEGGSLIQVQRIQNSDPMYTKPTLDYVPYIYTPFYFLLSALFSALFGIQFFSLRLVSFLSSLGTGIIILLLVHRVEKKWWVKYLGLGIYMSIFKLTGFWFDIARVDSLSVFLLFLGFLLQQNQNSISQILSGCIFTLAIYTKQTILIPIAFIFLYLFIFNKQDFVKRITPCVLSSIAIFIILEMRSDNWFSFLILKQTAQHSLNIFERIIPASFTVLIPVLPLLLPSTLFFLFQLNKNNVHSQPHYVNQIFFFLVGLYTYSLISTINPGSYHNVLLPFYAGLSLTSTLGVALVYHYSSQNKIYSLLQIIFTAILVYYFCSVNFSLVDNVPSSKDKIQGDKIVELIQDIDGEVYLSSASYLNIYADKNPNAHWIAISELLGGFGGSSDTLGYEIMTDLQQRIDAGFYDLIVLDSLPETYRISMSDNYKLEFSLEENDFYPLSGSATRPKYFYRIYNK